MIYKYKEYRYYKEKDDSAYHIILPDDCPLNKTVLDETKFRREFFYNHNRNSFKRTLLLKSRWKWREKTKWEKQGLLSSCDELKYWEKDNIKEECIIVIKWLIKLKNYNDQ
jgi:hypothetical protein